MIKERYAKLTISLPEQLLKDFQAYCEVEGMNVSKRIAVLIKKDLENKK